MFFAAKTIWLPHSFCKKFPLATTPHKTDRKQRGNNNYWDTQTLRQQPPFLSSLHPPRKIFLSVFIFSTLFQDQDLAYVPL